ncbi:helix-turn-helix transcriptional regulator [Roseateles saccharophilus]|uniref:helix-turn-helix domain-containing protein n=2 Tax=Roseateles saccharophilus TaxID=304 RepID=UPI00311D6D37
MPTRTQIPAKRVTSAREVLALNMIRLRAERGWSQEALAFEAELHRTFIAHVERQVRNISLDNVERIAKAFQVPIAELLTPELLEA